MPIEVLRVARDSQSLLDRVADDVFDGPIRTDWLAGYLDAPDMILLVAVDAGLVVGQLAAAVQRNPSLPPTLYLDNLGVAPDRQREGVGRRLIAAARGIGRAHGCETVWVAADADDPGAHAFYEAAGLTGRTAVVFEGEL